EHSRGGADGNAEPAACGDCSGYGARLLDAEAFQAAFVGSARNQCLSAPGVLHQSRKPAARSWLATAARGRRSFGTRSETVADCAASRSGKRNSNRCRPRLRPASRLCWERGVAGRAEPGLSRFLFGGWSRRARNRERRSEEHTSELQSRGHLVCRLLLETKKE